MDVQDHNKHSIPSGHESNGVHLCRRCGWPFPNPHPSARHRRSHKKICGTIDGYTNLNHSEVVSDDEHHPDDDKEKSPSPKIEKKTSIGGGGGAIGGSFSRSEDDSFSDAVTEFSDATSTGSVNKTLDRDMFFSFKDAENDIIKVDSSEAKSELPESDGKSLDGLVKDGVVEPIPEEKAEFIDDVGAGVNLERATADEISEEIKTENSESECKPVSEAVKEAELGDEHGSEVAKESEIDPKVEEVGEETKHEKFELDHEDVSQVVKEPETVQSVLVLTKNDDVGASEELKKDSTKQIQEAVEEPDTVLIEKDDIGAPKLEKDSNEQFQELVNGSSIAVLTENTDLSAFKSENCSTEEIDEVVKEPKSISTKEEDLGAPESEKHSNEHTHEVFEDPKSVVTENAEKTRKEDTMEVVQEPNLTLIEKEEVGAPISENGSTEQIQEVAKEPVTVLTEKDALDVPESEECSNKQTHEVLEDPKTVLTEKEDLVVVSPILEKTSKEHTFEVIQEPNSNLIEKEDTVSPKHSNEHTHQVLEVPVTLLTEKENQNLEKLPKEDTQQDVITKEPKADNCIVSEPVIIGKLMGNQDPGVDLSIDSSSRTSLEGNWGSVSVLSTASIDDKSKINSGKLDNNNHSGTSSDLFEPPSFMTLVDPQAKDQNKPGLSEVQDAQKAGWFPTITNVSNESEGRKKNEEVIAKVTNWTTTTGNKHSAPLKSLLGEAKSPNVKEPEPEAVTGTVTVTQKDEGGTELLASPPKLIEEGGKKGGGKKVKGRSSWMPFVCCSSVNVVK